MPAIPWSTRASLPPTYACFVTASQQSLRGYRDVPAFLRRLRAARRQLRDSDGLLGYALAGQPLAGTFWTVSAWVDRDAAQAVLDGIPDPALIRSTSVSWFCLAEELPVRWDEVRHRLRYAANARYRTVRPPDPVGG